MSGDRKAVLALAERVENASGPDRGLDAEIATALGWKRQHEFDWWTRSQVLTARKAKRAIWRVGTPSRLPAFTSSLDAALTFVPVGWTVARINENDDKSWASELREGYLTSYGRVVFGPANHKAPSPALALVAACLRALASAAPGGGA